jgi:hypothetical protein
VLSRVNSATALRWPVTYRRQLFREVRKIIEERFPDEVGAGLDTVPRLRYVLARRGRMNDMTDFSARVREVTAAATATDVSWHGHALTLTMRAELRHPDGAPLELVVRDGLRLFDPRLTEGLLPEDLTSVGTDVERVRGAVVVQDPASRIQWHLPADLVADVELVDGERHRVVVTVKAEIDPAVAAGGSRLTPGTWDVYLTLHLFGVPHKVRVSLPARAARLREVTVAGTPRLYAAPAPTGSGHLVLDVSDRRRPLGERVTRRVRGLTTMLPTGLRHRLVQVRRRRRNR